ncbi:MAG: zinc ABC transporter substrate-binding protein, partial [Candidatus Competibacteraceae bacterium]
MPNEPRGSRGRWILLGWALLVAPLMGAAAQPVVVASIKPVHALVAGVMRGVGEPLLLIPGGASPHEYSLRPSDTRALSTAQVVFWIGLDLESFLVKPLANAKSARSVALMDAPGLAILPLRAGGAWEAHEHDADHHGPHDERPPAANRDAHVWLDPT